MLLPKTRKGRLALGAICLASVALSLVAAVLETPPSEDPMPPYTAPTSPRLARIVSMTITVEESGTRRVATLECGKPNSATGYLTERPKSRYAACVTAVVSQTGREYLKDGALNRAGRCAPMGVAATRERRAEFRGVWQEAMGPIAFDRVLVVDDACDERLWRALGPLLAPRDEPIRGPVSTASDDG